jgi:hypothetical protein
LVKRAILLSAGASTEQEAAAFLISVLDEGPLEDALNSIMALASSRFREQVRSEVAGIVQRRDEPKLAAAFAKDYL